MHRVLPVLFLLFASVTVNFGQFTQTAGPVGGIFRNIGISSDSRFVASNRGALFEHVDGEWQNRAQLNGMYGFFTTEEALFYYDYYKLYRSVDKGSNWESIVEGSQFSYIDYNQGKLYISIDDSLLVSTDQGNTWEQPVVSQYANTILFGEPTVQKLIEIRSIQRTATTLILGCTTSVYPLPQGVYVTSDNGENWVFAEGLPDPTYTYKMVEHDGFVYLASSNGVYRSSDGGFNWEPYSNGLTGTFGVSVLNLIKFNSHLYAQVNGETALFELSGNTWVQTTDFPEFSCYFVKDDALLLAGKNKIIEFNPDTQSTTDFTDDIISMSGYIYPKSDQEAYFVNSGSIYKTSDAGESWVNLEVGFTAVKLLITGDAIFSMSGSGIYKSTDGGSTWNTSHAGFNSYFYEHCSSLLELNGVIYAGFSKIRPRTHLSPVWEAGGVYKSTNSGVSWTKISNNLPVQGGVSAPIYNMSVNPVQLMARTAEGLYRSTNGGANWSLFESGLPEWTYLGTRFSFEDKIYALSSNGLFVSEINQTEWVEAGQGLPEDFLPMMSSIFFENNGILYLYNYNLQKLYKQDGEVWMDTPFNFPQNIQFSELNNAPSKLWISTVDRGVWYGTIDGNTAVNNLNYNAGWNLVSIPTEQNGKSFSQLFSNMTGNAFSFNNGYSAASTPVPGEGYWINLSSPESMTLSGMTQPYTVDLHPGWNMIGPFHSSINISSIVESTPDLLQTSFFGYDDGYNVATTLEPGKGYWIKASQEGSISLNGTPTINLELKEPVNPSIVKMNVFESKRYSRTLSFGLAENASNGVDRMLGESELPPVPPANVFDARLVNENNIGVNSDVKNYGDGIVYSYNLWVKNLDQPFTIVPDFNFYGKLTMILNGKETEITDGEQITILPGTFTGSMGFKLYTDDITSMEDNSIPEDFNLYSNYPNPFNPSTTIKYDLPESSEVELIVFDILGNEVATLNEGNMPAGVYTNSFDGTGLSSGVYLLKMNASGESGRTFQKISKMILMK